jgi:chromosome segregation ATPase
MKDFETVQDPLKSCVGQIAEFRARLHMLERELEHTRDDLGKPHVDMPPVGTPEYDERQREIARLTRRLYDLDVAHANALPMLEQMLERCREKRTDRDAAPPDLEQSLRKAIEDPRYWRDGDPTLATLVSQDFKRLYPDDSEV